jgi:coenzyme F430 synthetase
MPEKRYPSSESGRDFIVLDTIHGGSDIARALVARGCHADAVDVYRGSIDINADRHYDHVVAPVHLDPDNKVYRFFKDLPTITHHEATGWIIGDSRPSPMIEITGARGKTTTAYAIAHLMDGPGILHTSCGTFQYPERKFLFRKSITPASLIDIVQIPGTGEGWLVAEESLGVTGAGDIAVITSGGDYVCAGGKKSALALKLSSASKSPLLIAAPGVKADQPGIIHAEDHISIDGIRCIFDLNGVSGHFENPLIALPAYAAPLMTAAATACMLGISPEPLAAFSAIPGRMAVCRENGHLVIDNSNTGTGAKTTEDAAVYAKKTSGQSDFILVIGQEYGAVCEGFPTEDVVSAITGTRPATVYIVGTRKEYDTIRTSVNCGAETPEILYVPEFEGAKAAAVGRNDSKPVVLAVKTWR